MKLTQTTPVTVTTVTEQYELPGFNPDEVYFEKTIVTRGENVTEIWSIEAGPKAPKHYLPTFVMPQFFEYIKTNHPFDFRNRERECLFPGIKSPEEITSEMVFVWISDYDHTLLDKNQRFIPYCHFYDYIDGPFDNECLHLDEKFIAFLKQHPWVVNKDSLEIEEIPSYNASDARTHTIGVKILPDVETYNEIMNRCKKDNNLNDDWLFTGAACRYNKEEKDYFGIRPFLKNN